MRRMRGGGLMRCGRRRHPWALERTLVSFSRRDHWTIADACEGTQVFGATGAGKTSGSGRSLAKSMLAAGFGGLVLTAKADERETWEDYCAATGRASDIIVVIPEGPWRCNFLDYELNREGRGAGIIANLVELFTDIAHLSERGGAGGQTNEAYWSQTLRQLLMSAIDLLATARGRITLADLAGLIGSAPQRREDRDDPRWRAESLCCALLKEADAKEMPLDVYQDFERTTHYWLAEFPALAEKTRSIIVSMFTSLGDYLLRRPLRRLLCEELTLTPEQSHEGAIIILDLPVHEYGPTGRYAQVIFKRLWQQAAERRNVRQSPRPLFLWADESQYFMTRQDARFQSTARSKRVASVYLTQNLPSYHQELDPGGGTAATDGLLGNLQTKIFHANGCPATNRWAEELIGRSWALRSNTTSGQGEERDQKSHRQMSVGYSHSLDPEVLAREFTTLASGGERHRGIVEGIVFQSGRRWRASGGRTHIKVGFFQNL